MVHIVLLLLRIAYYPALVAAGWLWERATRRFMEVKPQRHFYLLRLLLCWAGVSGPMWIGDENLLFFLLIYMGMFLLCYRGERTARIVTGIVFYLLLSSIGMMLDSVFRFIPGDTWGWNDFWVCGIKLLFALAVYLIVRRVLPTPKPLSLSKRLWWLCGLLSLAPLVTVLSFSVWYGFGREMEVGQYRIAYTVLPVVFLSALALLIALVVLSRHEELERSARLAQLREMYYKELQKSETQVRTLRHDLRNHLAAVQGLLAQNDMEQAQAYLSELTASPALHGARRVCEHELANIVLTAKREEGDRRGLTADFLVTLPASVPIADTDLCALLGNALDNAMEAAEKAEDKKITLRIRADRGMLMLRTQNACAEEPKRSGGVFQTDKADTAQHGFGLQGMREIAARYGGTMEAGAAHGCFELVVCLPLGGE